MTDPSSSTPADAPSVRWQFIDSSNNSRTNLTQVKRHVMQEYMRQKKGGSRQSESDEERPQAKRGRPKKTRAKRTSAKKARSDSDSNDRKPQKKTTNKKISPPPEDDDVEEILRETDFSSNLQFNEPNDEALFLPYRPSTPSDTFFPDPYTSGSHSTQSDALDFNDFLWSSAPTTPNQIMQSPKTMMSAARTDPFNTLPIDLDQDGQRLFDFYVNTMPACSYGSHFRTAKAHNWYTAVFVPEGMKGAVAFQNTIIVHAANTWSWVRNEGQTPNTLLHRDRAVTMLREHVSNNPHDISDVAIISCLSAAALEDFDPRPGRKEISWIHMRAAREMIRARGGPAAFAYTRLGMLINWQDYILSGYETHGPSFFYEHKQPSTYSQDYVSQLPPNHSMPSPPYSTSSAFSGVSPCPEPPTSPLPTSPIEEIRDQCEVFLDFLRRCEELSLYQRDNPECLHPARQTIVEPTCLLHRVLAAPPGARFSTSGDRKQMVARLVALMILNAALWDYRHAPARAGLFLTTLERAMINSEVEMSGSVEAILQILLECNDGNIEEWSDGFFDAATTLGADIPDYSQYSSTATSPSARPWFAGRMLKIAKRLRSETWYRVSEFLFSCLTLQVQESSMAFWEADLRQEILDAPLTSYHMRSLIE